MPELRIAIVCDWLTNLGGAERVVQQLHKAFPTAPIYTSLYRKDSVPGLKNADVRTSWLQKIPGARRMHQLFLPWMPQAFESFDLTGYDVVISSSFACSKGVLTNPDTVHICYCHNPTRYFWDESQEYWQRYQLPKLVKLLGRPFLHKLRMWDWVAAQRPDYYVANSEFVARRIAKYYDCESEVIYPGIELPKPLELKRKDFYLAVGRLTAHKYFDLIVKAFNELKLPLKIVGTGGIRSQLESLNESENTDFLGFVSENELQRLYASAKALVFPQCEDFGIVPIEAQAQECPVIAYKAGGALETVADAGLLFDEQTVPCLVQAVKDFAKRSFDAAKVRQQAERFGAQRFREEIRALIFDKFKNRP